MLKKSVYFFHETTFIIMANQEEKYYTFVENLNSMLNSYNAVLDSLDGAERKLLQSNVAELKRVMKPGFTRLNWNSLGIHEFIQRCNQVSWHRAFELTARC